MNVSPGLSAESLFDLDAPSSAGRPERSTLDFMVDLDAPPPEGRPNRSTLEFMVDLDDTVVSREIELDADPLMRDAVAAASAEADAREASEESPADQGVVGADTLAAAEEGVAEDERPERLVALPIPEPARTADEQLQQRRQRTMDRIATARDAFRFVGHMGILEDQRKQVARMFIDLEAAVTGAAGSGLVKDPRTALDSATKEQLDQAERSIGPIEEKLLTLDDQIDDGVFEDRVLNTKQSKKVVARYGRLLASRRMPAGPRRNRFEWIAFHLLTRAAGPGSELRTLPPDRARNVLQHLIGGLPRKVRSQETDEATSYLHECGKRLDAVRGADELFESGLFVDVYGYKVSMREQLLSPEFVYASVRVEVKLRNAIERWLEAQDRLHNSKQLTSEGTPRERLVKRLKAEQWDVDSRFGAKARALGGVSAETAPVAAPVVAKRHTAPARPSALQALLGRVQLDRRVLLAAVALLVIVASAFKVGSSLGLVAQPEVRPLQRLELAQLSPALTRGLVLGSDDDRRLRAWTSDKRWSKLDARRRSEAATTLAEALASQGIGDAEVFLGATPVMRISDGTVLHVEGGRI